MLLCTTQHTEFANILIIGTSTGRGVPIGVVGKGLGQRAQDEAAASG